MVCEVIKKIKEEPGFDRALSFILFKKWLDIVPASADELAMQGWERAINTLSVRRPQRDHMLANIGHVGANIGQWRRRMHISTEVRDSDGKSALVH